MRKDPKSGEVFDYVEPVEPKTKGVFYKLVESMGRDAGCILLVFALAVIITLSILAYNVAALVITEGKSAIEQPRAGSK